MEGDFFSLVIPAQAGIQLLFSFGIHRAIAKALDSSVRWNDDFASLRVVRVNYAYLRRRARKLT